MYFVQSCFHFGPCAVELVVTTSLEGCLTFLKLGNNFRNCTCFFFTLLSRSLFLVKVSGVIPIHLSCVVNREIQASGLQGPIPSSISGLSNLTELWVLPSKLTVLELLNSRIHSCDFKCIIFIAEEPNSYWWCNSMQTD